MCSAVLESIAVKNFIRDPLCPLMFLFCVAVVLLPGFFVCLFIRFGVCFFFLLLISVVVVSLHCCSKKASMRA